MDSYMNFSDFLKPRSAVAVTANRDVAVTVAVAVAVAVGSVNRDTRSQFRYLKLSLELR